MTADERGRMRATLRQAVAAALLPGASLTHPGPPPIAPTEPDLDLCAAFRTQLTALAGVVHETTGIDDIVRVVAATVAGQPSPAALMWAEDELPVPGLRDALAAAGIAVMHQTPEDVASLDGRQRLASCSVGITGAAAGLAQTGSIVVVSGPGRGRLASLLPPVHVALLRRDLLVRSLPDLITARPELVTSGANVVVITGPSRTADIEHTLSRGVHGPKEVHVILI